MSYITIEENIIYLEKKRKEILKKCEPYKKALMLIEDAKARYIKPKVKARSRRKALENVFIDLAEYEYDYNSIHEAYGCDSIDEHEFDRLTDLLELYKQSKSTDEKYADEVTILLDNCYELINEKFEEINDELCDVNFNLSDQKRKLEQYN